MKNFFDIYNINLLYGENFHLKNEIIEKLSKIFKKIITKQHF